MITVVILGGGNLALHLFKALQKSTESTVVQVYNRSKEKIAHLAKEVPITDNRSQLIQADVYVLAVSDGAIAEVSKDLTNRNAIVAHTSGSASLDTLSTNPRRAVFYPLQTFTKGRPVDFKTIPICLETEQEEDLALLKRMALSISDTVCTISTQQRQALHLAAVFVNNFTNHLYHIGHGLCAENHLLFDLLLPLIKETAQKIETLSPLEAQTGPAKRNDTSTLARHENQLKQENHKAIYKLLSTSIQTTYGKKL